MRPAWHYPVVSTPRILPMSTVRRHTSSAVLLLAVMLGGCQGVSEKLSTIDWQDKGGAGPAAVDGSPLSASVADRLAATPMTMNEQIKVGQLRDNRIRLGGLVSSTTAAAEAMRVARQVEGVSDVLDTMSVR